MKKLFLIISTVILLQQPSIDMVNTELELISKAGEEEGWNLQEWQVIIIEKMPRENYDNITNMLQNSYLVTTQEDENKLKYTFESQIQDEHINHSLQALVDHHSDIVTVHIVLSGQTWDESAKKHYKRLTRTLQHDYNFTFTKKFTCLKFGVSGIINDGILLDEFWKNLQIVHKLEQDDNIQHSSYDKDIYGYSPLWSNQIQVDQDNINFQMTIKSNEANKKEIIIGTPMLLNEY